MLFYDTIIVWVQKLTFLLGGGGEEGGFIFCRISNCITIGLTSNFKILL